MGKGKIEGCGANFSKYILFLFNLLIFLAGLVIFAISIWMTADKNFQQYLVIFKDIENGDKIFKTAMYVLIGVGALVMISGFAGCCGAIKESTCLLSLYATILIVLLVAQFLAAILAIVFRTKLGDGLKTAMIKQVSTKLKPLVKSGTGKNDILSVSWSVLQDNLKCCGGANYTEYKKNEYFSESDASRPVPQTCCNSKSSAPDIIEDDVDFDNCYKEFNDANKNPSVLRPQGCYEKFSSWIINRAGILIGIAIGVAFIQILGIVFACSLKNKINRQKSYA